MVEEKERNAFTAEMSKVEGAVSAETELHPCLG